MGTITITTTTAQDQRIAPAFGDHLQLGGNANGAQVKGELIAHIKRIVRRYEVKVATAAANAAMQSVADIDIQE